jgi:hypothetical protein
MPAPPRHYDAFISFKHSGRGGGLTPDADAARAVYDALTAAGIRTFFSPECLKHHGQGRYTRSIEAALEAAKFLVLVASCREHIDSRWVETEWDAFINDVRSGHKPEGDLVILNCGDLAPAGLPLFLRRHSMFRREELDALVEVVKRGCARAPGLGDVIQASLHCFVPKKNMDRIYIVTAHSPGGADYVIKTHWGPRDAKRLASMVKKTGVGESDIRKVVDAIAAEKTRGAEGYTRKPWRSLLTLEAMRAMAAELAVEMPGTRRPRSASAARGAKPQPERVRARRPRTTKARKPRRSS